MDEAWQQEQEQENESGIDMHDCWHAHHPLNKLQGERMNKIVPAFIAAKKDFSPALKDKTNPAFRSKYADLGACLEAVNDALLDNGIAIIQETFDCESGITVETVLMHESGETIRSGKLHIPAIKQDPQGYGSALTYARRYSLMAVCGIAPEDDDGNASSNPATQQPSKPAGKKMHESEFDDHMAAMEASSDADSLKASFGKAWNASAGDSMARSNIKASYDALMAKFTIYK